MSHPAYDSYYSLTDQQLLDLMESLICWTTPSSYSVLDSNYAVRLIREMMVCEWDFNIIPVRDPADFAVSFWKSGIEIVTAVDKNFARAVCVAAARALNEETKNMHERGPF